MGQQYYAHTLEGKPPSEWQTIRAHLDAVADNAASFASVFEAAGWGYLAGAWHDIGKYSKEFQRRLGAPEGDDAHIETKPGRVDHSTAGAQHAHQVLGDVGKLLAYAIAGHHGGLLDGISNGASLADRLKKEIPDYFACPKDILQRGHDLQPLPFKADRVHRQRFGFQCAFFTRMVYSCLVDADFLDTEQFMDKEKASWRCDYPSLYELHSKLMQHLEGLSATSTGEINRHRAEILKTCLDAAEEPPGFFSLTVPTGGGKTLSSLAFALKHALKHGMQRVIYVIPYTSIIEQNADVFRGILGEQAVLEHHSNFEPKEEDHRSRLASENWDAPLIVTTNVQFFESLFASRSSRCRKIHNIAGSVVILDEAQMLPVPLLQPFMEAMKELVSVYRTTIVLCTATQPALSASDEFKDGLHNVREIVPDPKQLYNTFRRVSTIRLPKLCDDEVAEQLKQHEQVLCVVNTRAHARTLFEHLRKEGGCYHLSALMYPEHRTCKLKEIRAALGSGLRCRVVSTQLIEAGVDIDFPVVFRAMAGIDSIAQAAGRCNREGKLPDGGTVYVFTPEKGTPPGYLRHNAQAAESVIRHHEQDILSLEAVGDYFKELYWLQNLDQYNILEVLTEGASKGNFAFKTVAALCKIIKEGTTPIIIPREDRVEDLVKSLFYADRPGSIARRLQRYTVQVYPQMLNALLGVALESNDQYHVLRNPDLYDEELGLCFRDPTFHRAGTLMQ